MAKKRGRRTDVSDLIEMVSSMASIRNGNGAHPPASDPSANVRTEMELRAAHEREIRTNNEKWQKRIDDERQRAYDAKADKESARVDSRFAELQQQALTLVNTVATTAKAASDAVFAAATQQTEAMNQMRDLVNALGTTVTSLVAAGGGERSQRIEGRQITQWAIGIAVVIAIVVLNHVWPA